MKYILTVLMFIFIASPTSAQDAKNNMNCRLIGKKLALIESQLEVVVEKYKIYFRQKVLPKIKKAGKQKAQIKISSNNQFVKAMSNLTVAAATYEALRDACNDSPLVSVSEPKDQYKATIIPHNPETKEKD